MISSIEKIKLKSIFEHLLRQKSKIEFSRSFSFNEIISISQKSIKTLKSQIFLKLFSFSTKHCQIEPS